MLLAKINPAATFTSQSGPFAQPTVVTADYLTAIARPYLAGASQTNFQIEFGTYTPPTEEQLAKFNGIQSSQLVLTSQQLASWGEDDSVLLEIVASNLGTSVVETIEIASDNF